MLRLALLVCFAFAICLTGCGGWPYGDASVPSGSRLAEADVEVEPPLPTEAMCTQVRAGVALETETVAGSAADVVRWVEGFHTGSLIWSGNGNRTQVTIDIWDVRAFLVKAERTGNGSTLSNSDMRCATYLELVAAFEFATADKRISQSGELTLRAYGGVEAFGTLYFSYDALEPYAPVASNRCFQGLELKVLLGDTGFSGALSNDFTQGNCDGPADVHVRAPAAHWGPRWQSY